MMKRRTFGLGALATLAVAGCSSKFRTYNGPEVTSIVLNKGARRLYLLHGNEVLKSYKVALGFAPVGPKRVRGDGKTPEGTYVIDRRNPNSDFHLSVGISYPNRRDIELARAMGMDPGGDIFIHGQPNPGVKKGKGPDWTAGCIAVKNREIEEIYAMVRLGTPITIRA
ncbi:L,D-transpeptidase catalytic domain [Jhaorihella thermophila]|uniref:L,D-transpeptidase catalytic domain n=2 Tax=Jhaorihella thermophila TaxID=488547 RepID=A0A1H5VNH4_9RHOB|nr:L,D-transpeptidase catalytic domain [Jhaorihella thermophila]